MADGPDDPGPAGAHRINPIARFAVERRVTMGMIVLGDLVAPKERGRYYGYFSVTYTTAGGCGPLLGGLIAEHLHWSVIFWINIPMGLAALAITASLLRRLPRYERPHLLDLVGAALIVSASVAFMPFGRMIGETFGSMSQIWLLPIFGAVLGFVTTWGEPAVRILADQVEQASTGAIRQGVVLIAVCIGVAVAVGIGVLRIVYDLPLVWILVPGYALAIGLIWLSDRTFVAIAVDSGGVATGPLANTFLLALAFGVAAAVPDRDPLVHGLGLVALIALAPIISVMLLGLIVRMKSAPSEVDP